MDLFYRVAYLTDIFSESFHGYTVTQRIVEFNGGSFVPVQPWVEFGKLFLPVDLNLP